MQESLSCYIMNAGGSVFERINNSSISVCALIVTIPRFSTYNWRDREISIWLVENITTPCSQSLEIFIQKTQTDKGAKISNLGWFSGVLLGHHHQKFLQLHLRSKRSRHQPSKRVGNDFLAKYSLTLVTSIISHTYILCSLSYI